MSNEDVCEGHFQMFHCEKCALSATLLALKNNIIK